MAQEAVVGFFCRRTFFEMNEAIEGEKCREEDAFRSEKNAFACRKAEKEQAQPQFYGTSYFLVRITPIGPTVSNRVGKPEPSI
jgi:hypothetical protein